MVQDMGLERCRVVLVEPHYPGNVGAAARVMANMGLRDLVLVNPVADLRDPQARLLSTHGESVLDAARVVATFDAAVAECTFVLGTSARTGGLYRRQNVGPPDVILPSLIDALARDAPAALVFGPEPTGLSNEIVTRCHHLIHIPTDDTFPALNLAQAVAICLYELRRLWTDHPPALPVKESPKQYAAQEQLFRQLQTALEEIHFLYGPKAGPLMHALRHLLLKARLTPQEVKLLLGLARQIRWYVAHHPAAGDAKEARESREN